MTAIQRVAIVGTGTIGAAWATHFLARGLDVVATDPAPGAEAALRAFVAAAWPTATVADGASPERLSFSTDLRAAVAGADFVQESALEQLELKRQLFAEIDAAAPPGVIIASSSSGLPMSAIQEGCRWPERTVTGHPFRPPHVVPLIEVVGGAQTDPDTIAAALAFYSAVGLKPIHLRKELPGHAAGRLQAALDREVVQLIADDVFDIAAADDAVSWGPGLRWGVMGPSRLCRAEGEQPDDEVTAEHDAMVLAVRAVRATNGRRRPRLFALEMSSGGRVFSIDPDGTNKQILVTGCRNPDGIALDIAHGHLYWTNMGDPAANDGSIERADLDGANRITIVPPGGTFTPKQIKLEPQSRKLYWCDREGMRVMRCNLDGSHVETLVQTGRGEQDRADLTRWCVGIAVDPRAGHVYWSQKGPSKGGRGRILRAGIELPVGETPTTRSDIEVLFTDLPEPIDLELDDGVLYWTDRGDPPRGNSVSRAVPDSGEPPEVLVTHLMEGIGLALDRRGQRLFCTDFAGSLYVAGLDGSGRRELLEMQGNLAGIAFAELR